MYHTCFRWNVFYISLHSLSLPPPACKLDPNCFSTLQICPPLRACNVHLSFPLTFYLFACFASQKVLLTIAFPFGSGSSLFFIFSLAFVDIDWSSGKYILLLVLAPPWYAYEDYFNSKAYGFVEKEFLSDHLTLSCISTYSTTKVTFTW